MKLRSGQFIGKVLAKEEQPFRMITLKEKPWLRPGYVGKRKEPSIALSEAWSNWVHKTKKYREWILFENVETDQRKDELGPYEVNIDFDLASDAWVK